MIDWNISIGNILTFLGVVGTAGGVMFNMGRQMAKFDNFTSEIGEFRGEMKELSRALSTLAVQSNRLDMHDKLIDELRRGVGYIVADHRGHGQ